MGNTSPDERADRARQQCAQNYIDSIFEDFNHEFQFMQEAPGQAGTSLSAKRIIKDEDVAHDT